MIGRKAAMTLAEDSPDKMFKIDAGIVFRNEKIKNDFVLRTTLKKYESWKIKYSIPTTPFKLKHIESTKQAAFVDNEVWVYGIDGTKVNDIVAAVKIGMHSYDVKPQELLSDIYVKNLNANDEDDMTPPILIRANKKLYGGVCEAVRGAAKILGVSGTLNFWILSSVINHKIPRKDLHDALKEGGAKTVESEDDIVHKMWVKANEGPGRAVFKNNLHLATLFI